MPKELWWRCLDCDTGCCDCDMTNPLFLTQAEKNRFPGINKTFPCAYFNKNSLCDIHPYRPFDCRLFPFDIEKIGKKYYWITWEVDCPIVKYDKTNFEPYLKEHEAKLIPKFKKYLEAYHLFRNDELKNKYSYAVLREIKIL
jgi:hypothetical protein